MISSELAYIIDKWDLVIDTPSPVEIPDKKRTDLAKLFAELGYKSGAEIGTASGSFAYTLAKTNRKAELFCVDAWEVYDGYGDITEPDTMADNLVKTYERLQPFDNVQIIDEYSMKALKRFFDDSLDYVYIDANHEWPYVTQDIYYWSQKVRPGGIVAGHDYHQTLRPDGKCHVKPAVDGYTEAFEIEPWFLLGNQTRAQSWMWVKS